MLKFLPISLLLRNVFAVASGTAAAQVVVFAFSPLITRIYSPEVFGLQGVFLSLIGILSPVIALRYPSHDARPATFFPQRADRSAAFGAVVRHCSK